MDGENGELVSDVVELTEENHSLEVQNEILLDAVEAAARHEEAAIQTAEQIAAAAMESVRGQEIHELRQEISTWQNRFESLEAQFQSLLSSQAEMTGQLSAIALLQVASPPTAELSSLTPPPSEVEEAITQVQEILPEALQSVAEEHPVQPTLKNRRRWI